MWWNFQYLFSRSSLNVNSIKFKPQICRDLRVFLGEKLFWIFALCKKIDILQLCIIVYNVHKVIGKILILTNQNGFMNVDNIQPWSGSWSRYSRGLLEKMMTWMSTSSRTRWPRVAIINRKHILDQIHATSTNSVSKNILAPLNTITSYHR